MSVNAWNYGNYVTQTVLHIRLLGKVHGIRRRYISCKPRNAAIFRPNYIHILSSEAKCNTCKCIHRTP